MQETICKIRPVQEKGRDECLDVECPFWKAGQARYASVLQCYFSALERCEDTAKRDALLLDLGFHMVEDKSRSIGVFSEECRSWSHNWTIYDHLRFGFMLPAWWSPHMCGAAKFEAVV